MSNYTCTLERVLFAAWVESELLVDPKDYLWCDDEDELMDALHEDLRESCNTGDVRWKDSDCDINIPKGIIEEWKSLKGLE